MSDSAGVRLEHPAMNTIFSHLAYGPRAAQALEAVRAEAERLEALLSRYRPDSDISRINRHAGAQGQPVGPDTLAVLTRAWVIANVHLKLFDVTVGSLTALWSLARTQGEPPSHQDIRRARALVDSRDLRLDPALRAAGLARHGQSIDLGGIAKGYAGDRFLQVMGKYGVTSAYTNLGGNVVTLGGRPDGTLWRVGIRHPRGEGIIGALAVADRAVVTSGDDQRGLRTRDGRWYPHILDPATGWPAESGLASVTVVAPSALDADALSTMLFIAGIRRGAALLRRFPDAQAVFVDTELHISVTPGLAACFQPIPGISLEIMNIGETSWQPRRSKHRKKGGNGT